MTGADIVLFVDAGVYRTKGPWTYYRIAVALTWFSRMPMDWTQWACNRRTIQPRVNLTQMNVDAWRGVA